MPIWYGRDIIKTWSPRHLTNLYLNSYVRSKRDQREQAQLELITDELCSRPVDDKYKIYNDLKSQLESYLECNCSEHARIFTDVLNYYTQNVLRKDCKVLIFSFSKSNKALKEPPS